MKPDASSLTAPLEFEPVFLERIWGGSGLLHVLKKNIPSGVKIGESWEISGYPGRETIIAAGRYAGKPLSAILALEKQNLTGPLVQNDPFPLLYKFIDAHDTLSVQVHPSDAQAKKNNWGAYGKTECWYIVHAEPGSRLICGFKPDVTLLDIRAHLAAATLENLLNHIDIKQGDVVFVPAGTVHAVCGGVVLYEVQQSSDTTMRLYDWGRNGADGKPRLLHIEESLAILDTSYHDRHTIPAVPAGKTRGFERYFRVACRYFSLEEYRLSGGKEVALPPKNSFQVVAVLGGELEVACPLFTKTYSTGQSLLIPACVKNLRVRRVRGEPRTHFLLSTVPDLAAEVIGPLRKMNVPDKEIVALGGAARTNDLKQLL